MQFKQIVGQSAVKKQLIQSVVNDRISHAQLFLGPGGSGKLPLALAYAQYICCTNKQEDDSCGECLSCVKFEKHVHPDLHFVFPVANIKDLKNAVSDNFLSEWREALLENPYLDLNEWFVKIGIENKQGLIGVSESSEIIRKLNLKSFEGDYKIMVIWMAEKMNSRAANKLLKILEEPPEKTVFILISENHFQILPTVISRTQVVKISKIDDNDLRNYLRTTYTNISDNDLDKLIYLAEGSFNQALKLFNEGINSNFVLFKDWMRLCHTGWMIVDKQSGEELKLIDWVENISKFNRELQKQFLNYSLNMIRECLLTNYNSNLNRLNGEEKDFELKFAPFINSQNCVHIVEELKKAISHLERNVNSKIIFFDLSLRMHNLLRMKQE